MKQIGIDLVKVSMNFPVALWKRLRVKAAQEDTTATDILVRLAKEYLSRPRKEKKSR